MNGTSEVRLNFQAQAPAVGGGGDGGGDDREKQFFAQMKAVKGNEAAAKESKRKKELAMMTEEEVRNDGRGSGIVPCLVHDLVRRFVLCGGY